MGDGSRYNLSREPLDRGGVQASLGEHGGLAQEEEMLLQRGDRCWLGSRGGQCGGRSERTTIFPVPWLQDDNLETWPDTLAGQLECFYFLFPINNCTTFISNQCSDSSAGSQRPSGEWEGSALSEPIG